MQRKLLLLVLAVTLALPVVVASAAPPLPQGLSGQIPTIVNENSGWQIVSATVVSPGETIALPQGTFIYGYIIEAEALGIGRSLMPQGKFVLELSAFSPSQDMPGQQAGMWYVRGSWSITDTDAPAEQVKARHGSAVIKGDLVAELSFNPLTEVGDVQAKVSIPMSLAAGRWVRGEGGFTGNQLFEGQITYEQSRWTDVIGARFGR